MAPPPYPIAASVDAVARTAPPPVSVPFNPGVNTTEVPARVDFALGN